MELKSNVTHIEPKIEHEETDFGTVKTLEEYSKLKNNPKEMN
jgi:hypothetical protein